jgi:hypothetical protein
MMREKKRNAQAVAAWSRKGGAHGGASRPDVFDLISEYGDDELEELARRWENEDEALARDNVHGDTCDSAVRDEGGSTTGRERSVHSERAVLMSEEGGCTGAHRDDEPVDGEPQGA